MGYEFFRYLRPQTDGLLMKESDGQQLLDITHSGTMTTLAGAKDGADNLKIKCNTTDAYANIILYGQVPNHIQLTSGAAFSYYVGAVSVALWNYTSNVTTLEGGYITGDDMKLKGSQADAEPYITLEGAGDIVLKTGGNLKFGTYAAIVAETLQGYVTIKDDAGNTRKLGVIA